MCDSRFDIIVRQATEADADLLENPGHTWVIDGDYGFLGSAESRGVALGMAYALAADAGEAARVAVDE